jgi:hypothetical protein
MLMYVKRGVLPPSAVSPVYTYGAPAIFCEGGAASCACEACGVDKPASAQDETPSGVLKQLGLPDGAVR